MVIADESHTLRTTVNAAEAQQTAAVCALVRGARYAALLSGTPSVTRPYDMFHQVWRGTTSPLPNVSPTRRSVFWLMMNDPLGTLSLVQFAPSWELSQVNRCQFNCKMKMLKCLHGDATNFVPNLRGGSHK